ncbi:C-C motif chemokine 3-like [Erpetoichthys calabaricus]|uniref:C-C motif chemokine n=1 Tax=Erpetoichthys calabaricus TaxID=27687 RepID=A0A8C4SKJ7_ERPCA|nr:C-C motif chemokine 3-like [Erpetoichthys calabaricus]
MKIFVFTIVIALLCTAQEIKATESAQTPTDCCFKFTNKQLPKKTIDHFEETSNKCPVPGVIFHTKKGHKVCASANEEWVKEHIKKSC